MRTAELDAHLAVASVPRHPRSVQAETGSLGERSPTRHATFRRVRSGSNRSTGALGGGLRGLIALVHRPPRLQLRPGDRGPDNLPSGPSGRRAARASTLSAAQSVVGWNPTRECRPTAPAPLGVGQLGISLSRRLIEPCASFLTTRRASTTLIGLRPQSQCPLVEGDWLVHHQKAEPVQTVGALQVTDGRSSRGVLCDGPFTSACGGCKGNPSSWLPLTYHLVPPWLLPKDGEPGRPIRAVRRYGGSRSKRQVRSDVFGPSCRRMRACCSW